MRPNTKKYLDEVEENSKIEFEIICTDDCDNIISDAHFKCKKGDKFQINNYEYNYGGHYLRLIVGGKIVGFFDKSNFLKLSELRDIKIKEILK